MSLPNDLEQPILRARQVWCARGSGKNTFTIHVPELDVHYGNFVALVGPSGSGKSTLLDMLSLVLRPGGGESLILRDREKNITDVLSCWKSGDDTRLAQTRRRLLGYVLQTGGLLPYLNVMDNIALPLRLVGKQPDLGEIEAQLAHFGLQNFGKKKPSALSGGERQRVAILRALVHSPSIILADEPTAALDHANSRTVVKYFQSQAKKRGTAIVMVTHDEPLVTGLADLIVRFVAKNSSAQGVCYSTQIQLEART